MPPRTTLVAEIGENHIGDWEMARRMVVEAAHAGADIVKFQSYRGRDASEGDPEKEWFVRVELPDELHFELRDLARKEGVEFLSAPFTVERARFLREQVGLTSVKIASSEMTNVGLLEYVHRAFQTVYLSTGMATLEEVRQALSCLNQARGCVLLHCVTQYPVKDEEANLLAIRTLKEAFPQMKVGYSDHTLGTEAALAAVALGACVIEKHFTLSKTLPGTDQLLSATPEEFAQMCRSIRRLEKMRGTGEKGPTDGERRIRAFVRSRWRKEEVAG